MLSFPRVPVLGVMAKEMNPRLFPLAGLVAVILAFDALSRLVLIESIADEDFSLEPVSLAARATLGSDLHKEYLSKLQEFEVDKSNEEPVEYASLETIKLGKDQDFWEVDEAMYRLVAILKGRNRLALIDKVDKTTGLSEIIKVRAGEKIKDFLVDGIGRYSITITTTSGDISTLRIFERNSQAVDVEE